MNKNELLSCLIPYIFSLFVGRRVACRIPEFLRATLFLSITVIGFNIDDEAG
jgi:hypothetical protein